MNQQVGFKGFDSKNQLEVEPRKLIESLAARLSQMKSGGPLPEHLADEIFFGVVGPHLNRLKNFVRHEIANDETTGDLARGAVTTEDVEDAALIRAHQEYVKTPVR